MEAHAVEADGQAAALGGRRRFFLEVHGLAVALDKVHHLLDGAEATLEVAEDVGDAPDAAGHEAGHEEEAEELLRVELPALQHAGALKQHDGDGAEDHDDDEAREGAAPQGGAEGDAADLLDAVAVSCQFVGLPREGLDAHDAREGLADDGVGAGHGVLRLLGQLADEPAETHGGNHGHGQSPQHQQGQFPAEGHEGEQTASDDDGLANELGEHHRERVTDGLDVGGDAAAEVAHAPRVEEGHRLRDHPGEGVFAEGLEHARGDFPEEPDADEAQGALDHEHQEDGHADLPEVTRINGQGQFESALPCRGVDPDAAELAPEAGHNEGQHAR